MEECKKERSSCKVDTYVDGLYKEDPLSQTNILINVESIFKMLCFLPCVMTN
jgi:hypothetical protein